MFKIKIIRVRADEMMTPRYEKPFNTRAEAVAWIGANSEGAFDPSGNGTYESWDCADGCCYTRYEIEEIKPVQTFAYKQETPKNYLIWGYE